MKRSVFFIIIIIIIISNIPLTKVVSNLNFDYYRYSNFDGTITEHEIFSQGRIMPEEFALGKSDGKEYLNRFPELKQRKLYRLFKINPLCFWRWGEYICDWRFRLPYLSWKEIKERRGYDPKYSNMYQEF